jgi:hypothetical protein
MPSRHGRIEVTGFDYSRPDLVDQGDGVTIRAWPAHSRHPTDPPESSERTTRITG